MTKSHVYFGEELPHCFPKGLCYFTSVLIVQERSSCSTSLTLGQPVILAIFFMHLVAICVFFGEVPFKSFAHFKFFFSY